MFLDHLFRTREKNVIVPIADVPWMMGLRAMPEPGENYYERAFVYTGATNAIYTRGALYQCTRSGSGTQADPWVYAWTESRALLMPADVVNDLITDDDNAPLSATMGKNLYELLLLVIQNATDVTGSGILSGLEVTAQETPDMTVAVSGGVRYLESGTRQEVDGVAEVDVDAADAAKDRVDLLYVDADGVVRYLAGIINVDAVAGARSYTVTVNAAEDDTVAIDGEVLTAIRTTPGTDEYNIGTTLALTATALYTILNANAALTALYTITNPSDGVVVLTETTPGGGNSPGAAGLTGDIVVENGSATESAAAVAGARQYIITDRAEENDTVVIDSQTFTCVNGTPGTDEFEEAGTIAATAVNLAAAIAANAALSALYNVTNPSAGVIVLTEKTPGGGNTPGAATPTGTLAVTSGDPVTSAAAVAGERTYTVTGNAAHKDTVAIDEETFTALKAAAGDNEFVPGATAADTATLLYNLINANAVLSAIYTATNPSAGVVLLTETTPGGLDTPGEAEVSGTIEITNGEATQSVAAASGNTAPDVPGGGKSIATLNVDAMTAAITSEMITKTRAWAAPGMND